jgi:hypothetical protein
VERGAGDERLSKAGAKDTARLGRSLLGRLLKVRCGKDRESLEDFLVETLAGVLIRDHALAERWLRDVLGHAPGTILDISTQRTFRVDDVEARHRRPDLWITTSNGLVLIEAKVDAPETPDQLRTYLDYADAETRNDRWGSVVFITPDGRHGDIDAAPSSASFYATTWAGLATSIRDFDSGWATDLRALLHELHMADPPLFLPDVASTLQQIPALTRALDNLLDGRAWRLLEESSQLTTPRLLTDGIQTYGYYGYTAGARGKSIGVSIGVQLDRCTPGDVPIPTDANFPLARVDIEATGDDRATLAARCGALSDAWEFAPSRTTPAAGREFTAYAWKPLDDLLPDGRLPAANAGLDWFAQRIEEVLRLLA